MSENLTEQPKSCVIEARDVILRAPQRIEGEFKKSGNTWLECFGSSLFALETYLDSKKAEEELGTEKYSVVMEKIKTLKDKLFDLKEQYPEKTTTLPDETKQELLEMLNVLK